MQKDILNPILSMVPFGYAYPKLVLDAEGNPIDCIFLEVNSAFEEMTGLKAGNIIGKKFTEAIPGIKEDSFDWVNFYGNLTLSRSAKETVQYSESLGRWYRVTAFSPEPYHFVTFLQDITPEMKRIRLLERQQEQIRELMQDYEVILNNTHEAIFLVGTDGGKFRYQRINPAFKNMTGFDESDIIGKTSPEVPGWEETGRLIEENYARCCRSGTGISYEVRAPVPLGEKIWHTGLTPVYNRDQVRYRVGSTRDITEEWKEVKKHPEIGYRIAHNTPELAKVAEFILHHHERWDGKGYPYGLKSEEIPHLCRILAVADAFDAMTGPRPYRRPVSVEEALVEIERNRGTQFDPDIARLFMEIMKS